MTRGIHWFRNDLRLSDNTALIALTARVDAFLPVFVLDPRIVTRRGDAPPRVRFLFDCLTRLAADLAKRGVPLIVRAGRPEVVLPKLMRETGASVLSLNEDVTPFARRRDAAVKRAVERAGGDVIERLDHVVFASGEIRTGAGTPYAVYSPYRNTWWKRWREQPRLPSTKRLRLPQPIPGLGEPGELALPAVGAPPAGLTLPTGGTDAARRRLERFLETAAERYHVDRDRPDVDGTSRLSPHLRFGTLSVRECFERGEQAARAEPRLRQGVGKWLDELVWRDFYSGILAENPHVLRGNHRREYDTLVWNDDPKEFEAFCSGRTGYPIVDAGIRQLLTTGWMHNRVRMIVASFLTKDLLIDWRKGERFFFEHLVDGDPASNNGGWQWAASTGTDAQPYFRIFNPTAQGKRWDPEGRYVHRFVPELRHVPAPRVHAPWDSGPGQRVDQGELSALWSPDSTEPYPSPIVDHAQRRKLALERFQQARDRGREAVAQV